MHERDPRPRNRSALGRHRGGRVWLLGVVAVLVGVVAAGAALVNGGGAPASTRPGQDGGVLFQDDFTGGRLDSSRWNTCHWWADGDGCTIDSNHELEWYLPSQVQVRDGALQLVASASETEGSDGHTYPYRSGMVTTGPPEEGADAKFAFTYGTVEVRLRLPSGRGLWPAVWLLPASTESRPEIDVLEVLGHRPSELLMHLHPKDRSLSSPGSAYDGPDLSRGWHTVRLDWQRDRLRYYLDGREVWQVTGDEVPDEPMYLILNLAVGGDYPGPPSEETKFPATYAIDWVRVTRAAP